MFEGANRGPSFLRPERFESCNKDLYYDVDRRDLPSTDLVETAVPVLRGATQPEAVKALRHPVLAVAARGGYPNKSHDSSQ